MIIEPAIDLKDRKVVRLHKGDFDTVHQVGDGGRQHDLEEDLQVGSTEGLGGIQGDWIDLRHTEHDAYQSWHNR